MYVGIGILILASLYIHVYIHHVSQVSGSILQYIILYMDRYVLYQNCCLFLETLWPSFKLIRNDVLENVDLEISPSPNYTACIMTSVYIY